MRLAGLGWRRRFDRRAEWIDAKDMAGDRVYLGFETGLSGGRGWVAACVCSQNAIARNCNDAATFAASTSPVRISLLAFHISVSLKILHQAPHAQHQDHREAKNSSELGNQPAPRRFVAEPWPGTAAAPLPTRPPRRLRAYLASTVEEPGLAPSRALLTFGASNIWGVGKFAADTAHGTVIRGFVRVCMERLRRGAEGGAEGPGAASRLGHTQNEATDLTAELAFTTIKAGRWSDSLFGLHPQLWP